MEDNYLSKEFMTRIYDDQFDKLTPKVPHPAPKSLKKKSAFKSMFTKSENEGDQEAPEQDKLITAMLE